MMKYEPVKDFAERKRILALIERCEKEQTMSRYIDTKWLEDNAKEYSLGYYDYDEYAVPLSALDSAPSIDLVRCAECKRVREDGGHANCSGYLYCRKWKTLVDEDQFCSWGERRDK